ncbi:MAG: response regulator transcription factor [Chloroflexi bacterium]|nr:response regulator transcription factor [Chloroflexota bacterium]
MPSVLIVDDHAPFRLEARRLLEAEGLTVAGEAANGRVALTLARSLHPDGVLLDIGLPDMDGLSVAEQLAAIKPPIRIILISSRDASVYGGRIGASAASGFIRKDELTGDAIRSLLAG